MEMDFASVRTKHPKPSQAFVLEAFGVPEPLGSPWHEPTELIGPSYGFNAVDILRIKKLLGNDRLVRAISDVAWVTFCRQADPSQKAPELFSWKST
jgi:hypothetical protein